MAENPDDTEMQEKDGDVTRSEKAPNVENMDTCYSWVILAAGFVSFGIVYGYMLSFGVYVAEILDVFHCSRQEASTLGSVAFALLYASGPLSSVLYNRFGSRVSVMLGGAVASSACILAYFAQSLPVLITAQAFKGLGLGITVTSVLSVQTEYFHRFRNVALSLVTVGVPIAVFVFPKLFLVLIETFSMRGSFLINAGILLQLVVCGALMKSRRDFSKKTKLRDMLCAGSLCRDIRFYLYCFTCFSWSGIGASFYTTINSLVIKQGGLTTSESTWIVSICGISDFCGRTVGTIMSQFFPNMNRTIVYALAHAFISAAVIATSLSNGMTSFLPFAALYGFNSGLLITSLAVVMVQQFGVQALAQVQGNGSLFSGVGAFAVSLTAGILADKFGYATAFQFTGCVGLLGSLASTAIIVLDCNRQKLSQENKEAQLVPDVDEYENEHTKLPREGH